MTYQTGTRQLGIWLYFNGNFSLGINISDRSCVTNVTYQTGTRQLGIWLYFNGNFSLWIWLYFNGHFSLCTCLVSHCVVVRGMITRRAGKLKPLSVRGLKNRSNLSGKFEDFSKPTGKAGQWTILLCVGGKNRAEDSNFGEKTASRSRSFETAVSSLDFVYRKLRQIPENPPKTMKLATWTTETRQGEFIYLFLFKKK